MKVDRISVVSALALFALFLAGPAESGSGPSSTGGGSVQAPGFNRVTFGFSAVTHADGTVSGNVRARSRSTDTFVKGDVQCLDVQGNTATMGGLVLKGKLFGGDLTGLCYAVAVQDNGEGVNGTVDLVSFFEFGLCSILVPDTACSGLILPTVLEVQGNVQVVP